MWAVKRPRLHGDDSDPSDSVESDDNGEQYGISAESSDDDGNDETLIKNRLLKVLKHVESGGATDYAISGILPDAPTLLISIKVSKQFKMISIVVTHFTFTFSKIRS